ncbi:hypothetical protein BX600DRAFT_469774 [Xylariales sp. PMI_506]|nr:hypothetical protein BX600DRAFT_469774 [Xylariales sp. PMI_506]
MLSIAVANLVNFFYPLGNTPAVTLTQSLPFEKSAKVLLLGCGDLRHVLFTIHVDPRPLDVSCCDIQPAVIARNILLLSLLMDDVDGNKDHLNWNIFFHIKISRHCLERLQAQAEKLYSTSATFLDWRNSKYGKFIKFYDSGSLLKVRKMWKFYSTPGDNPEAIVAQNLSYLSNGFKDAERSQMVMTGVRSASPVFSDALMDLPILHKHFWEHGSTDTDTKILALATHLNPLFNLAGSDQALHYGTDPLLGFHLATAYAPLVKESTLAIPSLLTKSASEHNVGERVVRVARAEFAGWATSFRNHLREHGRFIARFFVGDALGFCHALHHQGNTTCGAKSPESSWYRDRHHFEPLVLDGEMNDLNDEMASVTFDVIDTSNLLDHLGGLSLFTAVVPLLKVNNSAIFYTEKLLQVEETRQELAEEIFHGDLLSVSMLMGVVPVDMVTNTSGISPGEESAILSALQSSEDIPIKQQFFRTAWKRPIRLVDTTLSTGRGFLEPISFEAHELANILYSIYLAMFAGENIEKLMAEATLMSVHKYSLPKYHRGSFAAFLKLVKTRVSANWEVLMAHLTGFIEDNSSHIMSKNYLQELYTWLHLLDVFSVDVLKSPPAITNLGNDGNVTAGVRQWKNIPSVVCITLQVPREKLVVLTEGDATKLGTPPMHCCIATAPDSRTSWENNFAALQLGFGIASTCGMPSDDSFHIHITENEESGWHGTLPLLVAFYVPTWILFLKPRNTTISLALQSTPQTVRTFLTKLGPRLAVFQTGLEDKSHVYITKRLPNLTQTLSVRGYPTSNDPGKTADMHMHKTITASISMRAARVISLTSRVDILSHEYQDILKKGCQVSSTPLPSAFNYKVSFGQHGPTFIMDFPIPVLHCSVKTRIARKSSYIELVADIDGSSKTTMYLLAHERNDSGCLVSWNMPYLHLNNQPSLDVTKHQQLGWLIPHISMMFSARQRYLRENPSAPVDRKDERTSVELQDSIFSLNMHYTGLQGEKGHVFGITCREKGGVNILLFVSALRLDLSNRSVVLDAAALPLYEEKMPQLMTFLQSLTNTSKIIQILVSVAELRLWQRALPLWAERCRTWSHRRDCEFAASASVSFSLEIGQRALCSCGEGILPNRISVNVPEWSMVAKHVVQVAISPLFYSALVEDAYTGYTNNTEELEDACENCNKNESVAGISLMPCSGCRKAKYCSKNCQRENWRAHKIVCKSI